MYFYDHICKDEAYIFVDIPTKGIIMICPVPEPPPGPSQCNYPRCGSDRTVHLKKDKKKDH